MAVVRLCKKAGLAAHTSLWLVRNRQTGHVSSVSCVLFVVVILILFQIFPVMWLGWDGIFKNIHIYWHDIVPYYILIYKRVYRGRVKQYNIVKEIDVTILPLVCCSNSGLSVTKNIVWYLQLQLLSDDHVAPGCGIWGFRKSSGSFLQEVHQWEGTEERGRS